MKKPSSQTRYEPDRNLAWREVGGKVAIVTPVKQELIILNPTGAVLWTHLSEGPKTREEMAREITRHFSVDIAKAEEDVEAFLKDLLDKGLIHEAVRSS